MKTRTILLIVAACMASPLFVVMSQVPTSGLVAHYPLDGNAADMSGYGNHGTVYRATATRDRFGQPNSAYSFNGIDSYIATTFTGVLRQSARTVSLWYNCAGITTYGAVFTYGYESAGSSFRCSIEPGLQGNVSPTIGLSWSYIKYGLYPAADIWHHLVFVVPAMSFPKLSDIEVYMDGNRVTSRYETYSEDMPINTLPGQPVVFGRYDVASYYRGSLDDIRMYNRALSPYEVQALFNEKTPVPVAGLVAYYPFRGNANDESGNGWHGVVQGASPTTDRFGRYNQAYSFNGINNYIETTFSGILGQSARTISLWYNCNGLTQAGSILSYGYESSGSSFRCSVEPGVFGQVSPAIGLSWSYIKYGLFPASNTWHHVVYVVPNMSMPKLNDIAVYYDGQRLQSVYNSYNETMPVNTLVGQNVVFGRYHIASYYQGALDDIRIYNRALTEQEIQSLFRENGFTTNIVEMPTGMKIGEPYPNPTTSMICIDARGMLVGTSIVVFDALGRRVHCPASVNSVSERAFIDLSAMPAGQYHVQITTGSQVTMRRITKL